MDISPPPLKRRSDRVIAHIVYNGRPIDHTTCRHRVNPAARNVNSETRYSSRACFITKFCFFCICCTACVMRKNGSLGIGFIRERCYVREQIAHDELTSKRICRKANAVKRYTREFVGLIARPMRASLTNFYALAISSSNRLDIAEATSKEATSSAYSFGQRQIAFSLNRHSHHTMTRAMPMTHINSRKMMLM